MSVPSSVVADNALLVQEDVASVLSSITTRNTQVSSKAD